MCSPRVKRKGRGSGEDVYMPVRMVDMLPSDIAAMEKKHMIYVNVIQI